MDKADRDETLVRAYSTFFNTPEGEMIMNDLETTFGRTGAVKNSDDALCYVGEMSVLDHIYYFANVSKARERMRLRERAMIERDEEHGDTLTEGGFREFTRGE